MNWFRSIASRIRRKWEVDSEETDGDFGSTASTIANILLFPVRVLFLPLKGLGLFHNTGIDIDHGQLTLRERIAQTSKWLLFLPFRILFAPVQFYQSLRNSNRRSDILYILPALTMIVLLAFVLVQVFVRGDTIEYRYKKGAYDALNDKDFVLAKTYFQRIVAGGDLTQQQKYQWAMILANTGEPERAEEIINVLAPDDSPGFGPVHNLKAISIASKLGQSKDPKILAKLRFHLQFSGDLSPDTQEAWATYYLAVEKVDAAIAALNRSADLNPNHYLMIATIYEQNGHDAKSKIALEKAEKAFRKKFKQDELDQKIRISMANVLARLKKFDEAEQCLRQGVRIQPDGLSRRALASFYVMRHDQALKGDKDTSEQMRFLVDAISLDPNYPPVYSRLVTMSMDANRSAEESNKIRKTLQDIIASDNPTSLAHFALSNVLWKEGNKKDATFYLEQAYKMDPGMVVILNNLAWMLAHSKEPDLNRALELSETAVNQNPKDGRFRDTLGTILFKMERYKDAVSELQLALSETSDKKAVHQKLAVSYEKLGLQEMANRHAPPV